MRLQARRRETIAALAGLAVILAGLAVVLLKRQERLAYSNTRVLFSETATPVNPGSQYCGNEYFPAQAAVLRLYGGTRGRVGPPLEVTVSTLSGRLITSGRRAGDYGDERPVDIRLRTPHEGARLARVCIRNRGSHVVQFADAQSLSAGLAVRRDQSFMRLDFMRAGRPRNLELAGQVAERASLMKSSLIGTWTIWALAPLMLGLIALAVRLVSRESQP